MKYWRKYGWKKTWKQLKYNYVMLDTPEQLLRKEIIGYIGAIIGMLVGITMFIWKGTWYYTIAMLFTILIFYAQLKGKLKQLKILKEMEEQYKKKGRKK